MHSGGAYGDGTTESGAGIECGAAGTTGKHGRFTLASGGAGHSGADRFAERAGKMNQEIARQLGLTNATVGKWRRRYVEQGVAGLHDELRPGRPRPISDERVARLVRKALETKPRDGTHWSIRQMADQTRISKSTVHRNLADLRAGTAAAAAFQALDGSIFRRESTGYCRSVLKSPGKCRGVVCGREEPDSSPRAHPADAAHRAGLRRRGHARLPATRDDHIVRGAGHSEGDGNYAMPKAPSAPGVSGFPARD